MELRLTDRATVTPGGPPMGQPPRLSLPGELMIAGFGSAQERDAGYAVSDGSHDWLWSGYDEIRFLRSTSELFCLVLRLPLLRSPDDGLADRWARAPLTTGGLRLGPVRKFPLEPTSHFQLSADGGTLIAVYGESGARQGEPAEEAARYRIAEGFELVFEDGRLAGWRLEHPERFLVSSPWDEPELGPPDPELAALIGEFIPYLTEPLVYRITDDADPELLRELLSIQKRARRLVGDGGRARAVGDGVDELIENWY